jgi:FKBP-type peptidyl-prolyl cis-trans isomerase FklB
MRKSLLSSILVALSLAALLAVSVSAQNANQQSGGTNAAPATKPQQPPSSEIPGLPTQKDKTSYAIGVNLGKGLSHDSIEVDPNLILQGLKDGLAGGKTLMTDEQVQATIMQLEGQVREQATARRQQDAETNKKAGEAFLAANKSKPGVTTLPSGLQYKVLKEGTGPKPTLNDTVMCNYRGTSIDGKEFDSSAQHGGGPAKFPVKGIIKGWSEALQLMPVGSKWELYVPPDLAYGERGAGGVIGPNQTLIFEVELVSIVPSSPPAGAQQAPGQSQGAQPAKP